MARSTLPLLLVLLVTLLYISGTAESGSATPAASSDDATIEFIRVSCNATTYPELCMKSLSAYNATIQQSPGQLAHTALSVSLTKAQFAHKFVLRLRKFKRLKKREYEAIEDCFDEMGDTVDRLSKSVDELTSMGRSKEDFLWHMSNVETWVSAALTNENTCLDGFSGQIMNGKIKASVRAQVIFVAQITSNALALVNVFAAL